MRADQARGTVVLEIRTRALEVKRPSSGGGRLVYCVGVGGGVDVGVWASASVEMVRKKSAGHIMDAGL